MKNFFLFFLRPAVMGWVLVAAISASCSHGAPETPLQEEGGDVPVSLGELARIFAELPMGTEHLREVHDAALASSSRGYDEEYTLRNLITAPGCGVGEEKSPMAETKAGAYGNPLRNLLTEHINGRYPTKAGGRSAASILKALAESDYQLYFPFSEDWDGETYPIITFDPGYGAESNYGYEIRTDADGLRVIDSVYVDEAVAQRRPVWVLNTNDDSAFTPLELFLQESGTAAADCGLAGLPLAVQVADTGTQAGQAAVRGAGSALGAAGADAAVPAASLAPPAVPAATFASAATFAPPAVPAATHRKLLLKTFRMLRSYDSWFGGASEFMIKLGAVDGFTASTEAELSQYSPSITDLMIVVRRRNVGKTMGYDAILLTDFTSQMEKLAFLVTEDDGGTRTSWKAEATVKVQSKSYGFTVDLPYNDKDDIVWRGQLTASFFQEEDVVTGRFGDVVIQFELE